jgi:autotransporter adhesin
MEGTAIAMSMAGATLPAGKTYAISAGWGTYRGEQGFSASGLVRLSDHAYASAGIGLGSRGSVGARAGVTLAW